MQHGATPCARQRLGYRQPTMNWSKAAGGTPGRVQAEEPAEGGQGVLLRARVADSEQQAMYQGRVPGQPA